MDIDLVLKESKKIKIQEDVNFIKKIIDGLKKLPWNKTKQLLKKSFDQLIIFTKKHGIEDEVLSIINKLIHGQYKKLTQIANKKFNVNEGSNSYWEEIKNNIYGAASFYPLLQAFLELDKVVKGTGENVSLGYVGAYGLIWASIVGGKVLSKKVSGREKRNDIGKAYMEM